MHSSISMLHRHLSKHRMLISNHLNSVCFRIFLLVSVLFLYIWRLFNTRSAPSAPPATCALPGCNEPAFVDPASGQVFPYCSKRHATRMNLSHWIIDISIEGAHPGGPSHKPSNLCALRGCHMPVARSRSVSNTYHCHNGILKISYLLGKTI